MRILAIDEESLKRIGQWPWSRETLARIIDRLTGAGAAVALDILLSEPDRMSPESLAQQWKDRPEAQPLLAALAKLPSPDETLAKALAQGPVVVAFSLNDEGNGRVPLAKAGFAVAGDSPLPFLLSAPEATPSLELFEKAAAGNGAVTVPADTDGIIRRLPLMLYFQGQIEPSLVAETLRVAQGASSYVIKASNANQESRYGQQTGLNNIKIGQFIVPVDANGNVNLYDTGSRPERFIPAWKLLDPSFDPAQLAGNLVLIGATAEGLKDFKPTPLDSCHGGSRDPGADPRADHQRPVSAPARLDKLVRDRQCRPPRPGHDRPDPPRGRALDGGGGRADRGRRRRQLVVRLHPLFDAHQSGLYRPPRRW